MLENEVREKNKQRELVLIKLLLIVEGLSKGY